MKIFKDNFLYTLESCLKIIILIIAIGLLIISYTQLCWGFTNSQQHILNIAKQEGLECNFPVTIQAIAMTESLAGDFGRLGDKKFKSWEHRSYGVMQVRFSTAKWILHKKFGTDIYTDERLKFALWKNDRFNIFIGRIYFEYLYNVFRGKKNRWSKAVLAYNVGLGNVFKHGLKYDPNKYLQKIKRWTHLFGTNEFSINTSTIRGDTVVSSRAKLKFIIINPSLRKNMVVYASITNPLLRDKL